MSDYANLREAYYLLLTTPPEVPGEMQEMFDADRERWASRNPDPEIEPTLLAAKTQAEWHLAQQALADGTAGSTGSTGATGSTGPVPPPPPGPSPEPPPI
jgi:hypothetical protein